MAPLQSGLSDRTVYSSGENLASYGKQKSDEDLVSSSMRSVPEPKEEESSDNIDEQDFDSESLPRKRDSTSSLPSINRANRKLKKVSKIQFIYFFLKKRDETKLYFLIKLNRLVRKLNNHVESLKSIQVNSTCLKNLVEVALQLFIEQFGATNK